MEVYKLLFGVEDPGDEEEAGAGAEDEDPAAPAAPNAGAVPAVVFEMEAGGGGASGDASAAPSAALSPRGAGVGAGAGAGAGAGEGDVKPTRDAGDKEEQDGDGNAAPPPASDNSQQGNPTGGRGGGAGAFGSPSKQRQLQAYVQVQVLDPLALLKSYPAELVGLVAAMCEHRGLDTHSRKRVRDCKRGGGAAFAGFAVLRRHPRVVAFPRVRVCVWGVRSPTCCASTSCWRRWRAGAQHRACAARTPTPCAFCTWTASRRRP